MRRMFLISWLFILLSVKGGAQDSSATVFPQPDGSAEAGLSETLSDTSSHRFLAPDQMETTQAYRRGRVAVKRFDKKKWKEIIGDTDFQEKEIQAPNISLPWAGPVLKAVSYVVIGGVILLLLYLVFRNMTFKLRIRRTELPEQEADRPVENIEDLDIDLLLAQARASGNFRAAVRFYYLGLLKKLHALNVIAWKKDKTNREYLAELFSKDFHYKEIKWLTYSYETVWYGDHVLHPEGFQRISDQFESVYLKIQQTREV